MAPGVGAALGASFSGLSSESVERFGTWLETKKAHYYQDRREFEMYDAPVAYECKLAASTLARAQEAFRERSSPEPGRGLSGREAFSFVSWVEGSIAEANRRPGRDPYEEDPFVTYCGVEVRTYERALDALTHIARETR